MPKADALHLARWTVTSGSNTKSRGAVVIEAGDRHWEATAQGNGAVDALLGAVDTALAEILEGHPRLVGYEVHAMAEGYDAEGMVTVRIRPPASAEGARSEGEYAASSKSTNIIASSIEAYVEAINDMLDETHWQGAAETAAADKPARKVAGRRGEYDKGAAKPADTNWFDQ